MIGWLVTIRSAYGAVLLLTPSPGLAVLAGSPVDRGALVVARILGTRELVQSALTGRHPTRKRLLAGAGVDTLHAASMLALARLDDRHRRLALHNAATATLLATASVAGAATTPVGVRT